MEFKKGSKVEVMNKTEVATSWCVAEVVSGNRHTCNLRYDSSLEVSKVRNEYIRPCPPPSPPRRANDWVVGDIVEVLDDSCTWKTATLVRKVSDGAHFSLRPHGSDYHIIVHKSHVRARQVWQHGQWLPILKFSGDPNVRQSKFGLHIPVPDEKMCCEENNLLIYDDVDAGLLESRVVSSKKRASPFCSYAASNKKLKDGEQGISDNCSVGSCSNSPYETLSGEESSNASRDVDEDGGGIHGLELHAYRFTLDALYASGPLTWDKEALLTNLRINLHISNDEHLIHLKNLISTH